MSPAIAIRKRQYVRAINKHVLALMGRGDTKWPPLNSTPVASSSYSTKGWQSIVVFHREDNSHPHPHHWASVLRLWWREGNHYQRTKVNISDLPAPNRALWRASLLQKRTFHRFSVDSYLLTKFWGKNAPAQSISKIETLLKDQVWQLISRVWKILGHRYQRPKTLVSDHPTLPCSMSFHKSVLLQKPYSSSGFWVQRI